MQKIPIRKYAFRLLIFSIIMALLTIGMQFIFPQYASPALPFIVLFFFFITLFTLYIVLRGDSKKDNKRFISSYLLSRIIKLFSCLLFLLIYVLTNKEDGWRFAISFIIIYFLYSFFEVLALKGENDEIIKKRETKNHPD